MLPSPDPTRNPNPCVALQEPVGVIGALETSMRDPLFYRWHSHMDDIFNEHKRRLPPYTTAQLDLPGVRVTGLELQTRGARRPNDLYTFWQQSDVDVSRGFDFMPSGPVFVRYTHLQHRPFTIRVHLQVTHGYILTRINALGTFKYHVITKQKGPGEGGGGLRACSRIRCTATTVSPVSGSMISKSRMDKNGVQFCWSKFLRNG